MFFADKDIPETDVGGGVTRRILAHHGCLMLVEFCFHEKAAVGEKHSHAHEQIGYVRRGRFDVTIGDETATLDEGDSYYVPADVPHGVVPLEAGGILIDAFTPMREDFLE